MPHSKIDSFMKPATAYILKARQYVTDRILGIPTTGSVQAEKLMHKIPKSTGVDANKNWKSLGAGVIAVYKTDQGSFVVRGNRFGLGQWKISLGGAVDNDETIIQAILRELKEETFGLLPSLGKIFEIAHMNNYREVSEDNEGNPTLEAFDYLTVGAEVQISFEELNNRLGKMNIHAKNANDALKALTLKDKSQDDKKGITLEERKDLASTALNDKHLMKLVSDLGDDGQDVLTLLENMKNVDEFTPLAQFKDKRCKALMTFTEYSEFEIVPLNVAIEETKNGKTTDGKSLFRGEKDSILTVTEQMTKGNTANTNQMEKAREFFKSMFSRQPEQARESA